MTADDPFVLDLEWNKPTATTHPLGIDIEVVPNFKTILGKIKYIKISKHLDKIKYFKTII